MNRKRKLLLTIAMTVTILSAFFGACKKDKFVPTTGVCPVVVSTDPVNASINVALDKVIIITFNEPMNPETITQASITLQGATPIVGTITASGNTAWFTPSSPLAINTTYTGRISTAVKDASGLALQTDYIWTFSTGATLSPVVIQTDPINKATDVPLNKTITATFNMGMAPLSINSTTFILKQGSTSINGTINYNGVTASFVPTVGLLPNTLYTATITNGAKNIAGTTLANNYSWSFTTGSTNAPTIISTDPVNNASSVVLNKIISADFSEIMNPVSLNATSFTLKQGSTILGGIISYSGTTAYFNPIADLLPNTIYTATITTAAENLSGTPLANNYVWTFTTGNVIAPIVTSTDPVNNATSVVLNKIVAANFNMPMDPLTINGTTMIVKQGATVVAGLVSYNASALSFDATLPFTPNTVYTATITTGAKNLAGVALANNYVWTFTTGATTAPTVVSTDPVNNAINVALNKTPNATFSMPMDPLTINSSTFGLKLGGIPVSGTVSYSGTTVLFTPSANLISGSVYTATITTGAKNLAGTPLSNNYVWSFSTSQSIGPNVVNLGSVAAFGIIAGVGVSNMAGQSEIHNMDVGIYPGVRSSIVGFPPAIVVGGSIFASDDIAPPGVPAMLLQAKTDLTNAYLFAEGASTPAPITVAGDQGGLTLTPGIYKSTSTLLIQSGNLTLDAQGDVNAVWIFQIASGFTTVGGAGGSVVLAGGAQAKNVFWQTGSSAVIGDYTSFQGTIMALTSITMNSHATAVGRMLARNGAVVMTSTNLIIKP